MSMPEIAFKRLATIMISVVYIVMTISMLLVGQDASARINRAIQNPVPEPITPGELKVELEDIVQIPRKSVKKLPTRVNYLYHAGDASGRLFVNDMYGQIYIVKNNSVLLEPFLDIEEVIGTDFLSKEDELGLSSFAFHPDYGQPGQPGYGKLYTVHSEYKSTVPDSPRVVIFRRLKSKVHHFDVITEWSVSRSDADRIDPGSRRDVMRIAQPWWDNNTGLLAFNPNAKPGDADYGMLYIGVGDGGNTTAMIYAVLDEDGPGQDLKTPLGSILRINPLQQGIFSYTIPSDNPFINNPNSLPEIWAHGFRNPQRFSWDAGVTRKMLIGDIGQANVEEINLGMIGGNYGWSRREGSYDVNRIVEKRLYRQSYDTEEAALVDPVVQYDHDEGGAIVGGFVYRGQDIPELHGMYVFGDIVNGRIFYVDVDQLIPGKQAIIHELTLIRNNTQTNMLEIIGGLQRADMRLGMDEQGELYILTKQDGFIRKISRVGQQLLHESPGTKDKTDKTIGPVRLRESTNEKGVLYWLGAFTLFLFAVFSLVTAKTFMAQKKLQKIKNGQTESTNGWIYYDSTVSKCILGINISRGILEFFPYRKLGRTFRIKCDEIDSFEIIAHEVHILKISRKGDYSFDAETEDRFRKMLNELEREPMRPFGVREIELYIMGKPETEFKQKVNFYFREGRIRRTRHPFQETIEDLVKWCRLLSTAIQTEGSNMTQN